MKKKAITEIKTGLFKRALSTGRVASSALHIAGRKVLGAKDGDKDRFLGQAISQEFDQMKGMAMKVGQILSYMDGALLQYL